jgi:uncharacterized protein YdeI (YjbR/CyaY-like superfamily)
VADSLIVPGAQQWREWLEEHHHESTGVWLVLAKKGTTEPTSLRYDEALEEALCLGWIDSQLQRRDEGTYQQRFTPRTDRSPWSKRNVGLISELRRAGRMHPAGEAQVRRAQEDGRWDAAYDAQSTMTIPDDLAMAFESVTNGRERFMALPRSEQFSVLYRLTTAKRESTRTRHITTCIERLVGDGESPSL